MTGRIFEAMEQVYAGNERGNPFASHLHVLDWLNRRGDADGLVVPATLLRPRNMD
jgi:hypothetical protein